MNSTSKKDLYLATTGLSEMWDLENRLLILGPWCLTDEKNKSLLEHKEYAFIPSPWKPTIKVKEAADYCYDIYERLLPQLCENLNLIHRVSYPERYWRVLLGHWLSFFIGILYDRYKRIEKALELFPDFYTYALPRDEYRPTSYDTYDFLCDKVNTDYYNLKLFSLVAYDLCPHNIIVRQHDHDSAIHPYNIRKSGLKERLFYKVLGSFDLFFKSTILLCDMYHVSLRDMLLFKLRAGFKMFRFMHFDIPRGASSEKSYSNEVREAIKLIGAADRFQTLLYKILPEAIPMCYIENFNYYRDSIKSIRGINNLKIIGSAVGWYFNERFKFFAAEAATKGAKLIDFQHGGGYGTSLVNLPKIFSSEEKVFYTWGWHSNKSGTIKPLPSPHLSRLRDKHVPKLDSILFIGVSMPRYHYRFETLLLPDDMPKYFEDKQMFFRTLTEQNRNNIIYRPYIAECGWGELDIVRKSCPHVNFILKGNLVKWMKKVKLVVIDHPHTSFIEALTINVPCVFYWDHEIYLMRAEAERYFGLLRDAEIVFKDPISAARKVEEICSNPVKWWMKDGVQKARLEFCRQYAYARRDWLDVWVQEFKQYEQNI